MSSRNIPDDLSPNDAHQWLNGGVCWYTRGKNPALAFVVDVREDDGGSAEVGITLVGDDEGGVRWTSLRNLELYWPKFGAINVPKFAMFISKEDTRQYRRTFNQRSLHIQCPKANELSAVDNKFAMAYSTHTRFMNVVRGIVRNEYYDYDYARQLMDKGERYSCALNRRVILVADGSVFYSGLYWGKVMDGRLIPLMPKVPRAITNCMGELLW